MRGTDQWHALSVRVRFIDPLEEVMDSGILYLLVNRVHYLTLLLPYVSLPTPPNSLDVDIPSSLHRKFPTRHSD